MTGTAGSRANGIFAQSIGGGGYGGLAGALTLSRQGVSTTVNVAIAVKNVSGRRRWSKLRERLGGRAQD